MKKLQIVGLGLAILDVVVRLREMPTWKQTSMISGFHLHGGGPAGTAMVAAAKLGVSVGFIGTAGTDEAAAIKLRLMRANGIDLSRLIRRQGTDAQVVLVWVHSETGERTFSDLAGRDKQFLRIEELDRKYITAAEYLHLDGFHPEASLQAAKWMQQAGKTVVLDGDIETIDAGSEGHYRELINYVDILIGASSLGKRLTGEEDICSAGRRVLDMGPRIFVETVGAKGCYTVTKDVCFHTPAFAVDVVDTTGAGDVFHGAYIVGLLYGWDLAQVAQFASAASAIDCTQLGGQPSAPSFDEVTTFLSDRGINLGTV